MIFRFSGRPMLIRLHGKRGRHLMSLSGLHLCIHSHVLLHTHVHTHTHTYATETAYTHMHRHICKHKEGSTMHSMITLRKVSRIMLCQKRPQRYILMSQRTDTWFIWMPHEKALVKLVSLLGWCLFCRYFPRHPYFSSLGPSPCLNPFALVIVVMDVVAMEAGGV